MMSLFYNKERVATALAGTPPKTLAEILTRHYTEFEALRDVRQAESRFRALFSDLNTVLLEHEDR